MEKYERIISLRTIFLTIVRRIGIIILFFVPAALATYVVTSKYITKTYTSTITLSNTAAISDANWAVMKTDYFNKAANLFAVASNLRADGHRHKDTTVITEGEIRKGLTYGTKATNATSVTITFQSTDSTITKYVLDELANVNLPKIRTGLKLTGLKVSSETGATNPTKNSNERTYLLIGLAIAAVVGLGVAFIDEIIGDEVYDVKDIASMGMPAFQIATGAKK